MSVKKYEAQSMAIIFGRSLICVDDTFTELELAKMVHKAIKDKARSVSKGVSTEMQQAVTFQGNLLLMNREKYTLEILGEKAAKILLKEKIVTEIKKAKPAEDKKQKKSEDKGPE